MSGTCGGEATSLPTGAAAFERELGGAQLPSASSWAARSIRWYQRAVEGRPSPCRFYPSCSAYALEAVERHGTPRGLMLGVRRLLRCRPFGPSGFDPVPDPRPSRQEVR